MDATFPEEFELFSSTHWIVSGNVARQKNKGPSVAIGTTKVWKGTHQWCVKYERYGDYCCGALGITTNTTQLSGSYLYSLDDNISIKHSKSQSDKYRKTDGKSQVLCVDGKSQNSKLQNVLLQNGDVIKIELNCNEKWVKFFQNDKLLFTENNIPISQDKPYRLGVCSHKDNQYTIIKSTGPGVAFGKISLQKLISNLDEISKVLSAINDENLQTLSFEELTECKKETSAFLDECKEYEQKYQNVKDAVQTLSVKVEKAIKPNTSNYQKWDASQICRYVLSLENQRFAKYFDVLKAALEKQSIVGADLPEIEANDLYTMGIDNFKDRKSLAKYFKNLDTNEGNIATDYHK